MIRNDAESQNARLVEFRPESQSTALSQIELPAEQLEAEPAAVAPE